MKSIQSNKSVDPETLITEVRPVPNPCGGRVLNSPDIRPENNYFQKFVNNLEIGNFSIPVNWVFYLGKLWPRIV